MKVELDNGKEYLVIWQHITPQQSKETKVAAGTACTIYVLRGEHKDMYANIRVRKYISPKWRKEHPKNQFSKESGRRISLDRVLKDRTSFDRKDRILFWNAYHSRRKVTDELQLQELVETEQAALHVSDDIEVHHES